MNVAAISAILGSTTQRLHQTKKRIKSPLLRAVAAWKITRPTIDLQAALFPSPSRGMLWVDRIFGAGPLSIAALAHADDQSIDAVWLRIVQDAMKGSDHQAMRIVGLSWLPDVLTVTGEPIARLCARGLRMLDNPPVGRVMTLDEIVTGTVRLACLWPLMVERGMLDDATIVTLVRSRIWRLLRALLTDHRDLPTIGRLRGVVTLWLLLALAAPTSEHARVEFQQLARSVDRTSFDLVTLLKVCVVSDGGLASRNSEQLEQLFQELYVLSEAMVAALPSWSSCVAAVEVARTLDRLRAAMVFFRCRDGGVPVFHGSTEGMASQTIYKAASDNHPPPPVWILPQSGYARLQRHELYAFLDIGTPQSVDREFQHAGVLACEVMFGKQRLIVNCGPSLHHAQNSGGHDWAVAMRSSAAHSTLVIQETNAVPVYVTPPSQAAPPHNVRWWLGEEADGEPFSMSPVKQRSSNSRASRGSPHAIVAEHDGYERHFGIVHRRMMRIDNNPLRVEGVDTLSFVRRFMQPVQFFVRFHLHPTVRAHLLAQENAVLIVSQPYLGWRAPTFRFETRAVSMAVVPSIYTGRGTILSTSQIVLTGLADQQVNEVRWCLRRLSNSNL